MHLPTPEDDFEREIVMRIVNEREGEDRLTPLIQETPPEVVALVLRRLFDDSLTGIFGRRAFEIGAQAFLDRAMESGVHVALLFLDIDFFKEVNTALTHVGGDRVLREYGKFLRTFRRFLKSHVRPNDSIIGRVGGEEFCVMLYGANLSQGESVAMRLNTLTNESSFPVPDRLSVSIGVASTSQPECSLYRFTSLYVKASAALQRAKHEGRNKVCV